MNITNLLSDIAYLRYPQYLWANRIIKILDRLKLSENSVILDAPCGDGIISFWLKRVFSDNRFFLCDISPDLMNKAIKSVPQSSSFTKELLSCPLPDGTDNIWLLINSFYLLFEIRKTILRFKPSVSVIIGVFPDLSHKNYQYFLKRNPQHRNLNINAMTKNETIEFFRSLGYEIESDEGITFIAFYRYYIRFFHRVFSRLLIPADMLVHSKKKPAYWIGVFRRINES